MEIIKNLVKESNYSIKCPYTMNPTRIVVHNTANDASACNEINYMINNANEVSYHYAIDDKEIVQGIPEDRNAWHSGDGKNGKGNREGIGIEICYSKSGGDKFIKAEQNAAKFIAELLKKYNWGIDKVTKHNDYSNKYCPHRTLDMGWDSFIKMIQNEMKGANMLLTLDEFIKKHTGEAVANPEEGSFKGECVSLVQMYIYECFGVGFKGRGNAKDYCDNLIKEGLATKVNSPIKGDIMGWYADKNIGENGHVAIYLDQKTCFDQSNYTRKTAQKRTPINGVDIYVRMKSSLINNKPVEDTKPTTPTANLKFKEGDKVVINGKLYPSSTAKEPTGTVSNKVTNITRIAKGAAHPYNTTGDLGWMNESDIKAYNATASTEIKVGDKVKVKEGAKDYNGKGLASFVYTNTYDVIEVSGNRIVIGKGDAVTAAVHKNNLYKV